MSKKVKVKVVEMVGIDDDNFDDYLYTQSFTTRMCANDGVITNQEKLFTYTVIQKNFRSNIVALKKD